MAEIIEQRDVEELLSVMEQWGIAELHLQMDETAVDLVRATYDIGKTAHPVTTAAPPPEVTEEPCLETDIVKAPVVGVFHLTMRGFPQGCPAVGDAVTAGQVIGTIELMHVPTELVSPVSGTIEALLAEDGMGVEYGQPLMAIRPFEEVCEDEAGMLPPPSR